MTEPREIAVLIGSLRKESITRKVANALIALAPQSLRCHVIEIGDLPLYNEDLDRNPPASWTRFRTEIAGTQAVILLTPEYNRSVPACIKNALDVGSRPSGENLWDGKPAGIISVTPYKMGAFGANHHLRQALVYLNMPPMQQPEAYIGGAAELFDAEGKLKNAQTGEFLHKFMLAFESWCTKLLGLPSRQDFMAFLERRRQVALAYSSGDPRPLDGIVAHSGAATFFPPSGGVVTGAEQVVHRYDEDAKAFATGAQASLEVLGADASAQLGYWTGTQDFRGKVHGSDAHMKLRVTEVYKVSQGQWLLIHRHADSAVDPAVQNTSGQK